jgi:hypothetical protein
LPPITALIKPQILLDPQRLLLPTVMGAVSVRNCCNNSGSRKETERRYS